MEKVGIRYCGGCNPRYDRIALVDDLRRRYPEIMFVTAGLEQNVELVLVLHGCMARCVNTGDIPGEILPIFPGSDLTAVHAQLDRIAKKGSDE